VRRLGTLPADWREFARSLVPLALLALAAAVEPLRVPVLVALITGAAVAIGRDTPVRWAWAAAVPVAVSLAWGILPVPAIAPNGGDCANAGSPFALWRALQAVVVLASLLAFGLALRANRRSLLLGWPSRTIVRWAVIAFLASGPLALLLGPILARPFFGDVGYDVGSLGAVVPALIFAIANGTMEELIYRGALLGWSSKVMGVGPALVGQAVVFGLAHSGNDVIGNAIPLSIALGIGGFIAGLVAIRTRSLLLPIAIHVGLDIPIYYAFACAT
jgi:membrane protease YdiL (CAAX protease family)